MRRSLSFGLACLVGLAGTAACSSNGGNTTGTNTGGGTTTTHTGGSTTTGTGGSTTNGPGASLKCDSSGKNAFQTYGEAAFVTVNKAIIANTTMEISTNGTKNVGDSFTKVGTGNPPSTADNLMTFEGKLAAFLVWVYGGPNSITYTDMKMYTGNNQDMVAAHTGLAITQAQYTYFVTNIVVPALTASGVKHGAGGMTDPNDVTSCFAPPLMDPTFIASIVGH
jgi:hypothetical protein